MIFAYVHDFRTTGRSRINGLSDGFEILEVMLYHSSGQTNAKQDENLKMFSMFRENRNGIGLDESFSND